MIMDIANQLRADLKMSSIMESNQGTKIRDLSMNSTTNPNMAVTKKRSFDVAFLMQPDEKLRSKVQEYSASPRKVFHGMNETNISIKADALLRQLGSPNSSVVDDTSSVDRNSTDSPTNEEIDIMTNGNSNSSFESANPIDAVSIQESVRYFRNQVNRNCPTISPRIYTTNNNSPSLSDLEVHRSAFTKVPHVRLESPAPPLSPDRLSCPSISPPTVSTTPPRHFANFRSSDYGFQPQLPPFMQQSSNPYAGHPGMPVMNSSPPEGPGMNGKSMKPQYFYRPVNQDQIRAMNDLPPNGYPHFQMMTSTPPASPQMHSFSNDLSGMARHPAAAAAILSTLIPPSIASTFSLAAQNVCAKCNISFRMTSDLVYHMRSHHKPENPNDSYRRKREEKLKCPVCNESFRERHHLTRHMTAHQDKESDDVEPPQSAAQAARNNHQLMAQEFVAKGRQNMGLLQINQQHQHHNKGH